MCASGRAPPVSSPPALVAIAGDRFDAVVFDMDGVITDTASLHAAAWKQTFDEFLAAGARGVTPPPFSESDYLEYVDGKQRDDGVASFLAARGIDLPRGARDDPPERDSVWGLANRKNQAFQRLVAEEGVRAFPTSVSVLGALRRRGFRIAVVSASRNCAQILTAAGVSELFDVRVDGVDTEELGIPGKPSPALFLEAARRLGAAPGRAVVVEDAIAGVQAGRAGGFGLVIGVDRTGHAEALRGNGADVVVEDLAQLQVMGESPDPLWSIEERTFRTDSLRVSGALFALADGVVGTSGVPVPSHGDHRWVVAGAVYIGDGPETRLLTAPIAMQLPYELSPPTVRRVLDLHGGVLREEASTASGPLVSVRFSSLARPGTAMLRATCPDVPEPGPVLVPPVDDPPFDAGTDGDVAWMRVSGTPGGVAAAARDEAVSSDGHHVLDRVVVYEVSAEALPEVGGAIRRARSASRVGFEALLAEHRAAWAGRWEDADVVVEGDDDLQRGVRFALFHLMASVPELGEAAVGARGLSGTGYRGHVFWDADTFALPFLAATHPASARAILEYRIRRLPAARAAARELGRAGARFPWESAHSGRDVTPLVARDRTGQVVPIRTGQLEEHIVAQVAWAASCYLDWSGDVTFAGGPGLDLLVETARYWGSRIRHERDGAHIYGVIGPDEYHEPVDDNAFTNVMARWNLRRAASAVTAADPTAQLTQEAAQWRAIADGLVDGFDLHTGIYEQFAGFYALEPLIIAEAAPRRPIAADLLLGARRVRGAQVIKQADVLMLHHLVPSEVGTDTLEPNLRFYEPRTAHGSSLSPGVHASLFARAGQYDRALDALRMTYRIDLDDLTATTGAGLHLATMGSLWQAMAFGFAGLRPSEDRLTIDPRLPPAWSALEVRVRFRGTPVRVRVERNELQVDAGGPLPLTVEGVAYDLAGQPLKLRRRRHAWEEAHHAADDRRH
jgi:beta-phosphoglucomutase family hydrolase